METKCIEGFTYFSKFTAYFFGVELEVDALDVVSAGGGKILKGFKYIFFKDKLSPAQKRLLEARVRGGGGAGQEQFYGDASPMSFSANTTLFSWSGWKINTGVFEAALEVGGFGLSGSSGYTKIGHNSNVPELPGSNSYFNSSSGFDSAMVPKLAGAVLAGPKAVIISQKTLPCGCERK